MSLSGRPDGEPSFREKRRRLVPAAVAVIAREVVERLGAVRALAERRKRLADEAALILQIPEAARLRQPGVPGLFLPAAHLGAFGIRLRRVVEPPGIAVALGEIKRIARDEAGIGLGGERLFEHRRIIVIFARVLAARAAAARMDRNPRRGRVPALARRRVEIFVQHALIGIGQPVAADMAAEMGDGAFVHQDVVMIVAHLSLEGVHVEAGDEHQDIVGVEHQRIVDTRDLSQA